MKYLSLCSGIEAATVAWHPLGWEAVAYSEIEKFPSQVLAHHYPQTPNLGDMTKFKEWSIESNVDLLVGGTPCQSFSVAGLRKGLDDPRGNLMLTYLAIADKYRPRWLVWENVPGVLSSNAGQDFGTFLGGLGELGYGFAYRVLDAQYFGVAQRRRRVFVVGYLGDWRLAAAVLFERHSLSGNPAPSREKRQGAAASTRTSADGGDTDRVISHAEVTSALCAADGPKGVSDQYAHEGKLIAMAHGQGGAEISFNRSPTLTCIHEAPIVSYGIPGNWIGRKPENGGNATEPMYDVAPCLTKADQHGVAQPMAYNISPGKGAFKEDIHITDADATKTLDASASNPAMHQGGTAILQPIAFSGQMSNPQTDVDMTQTLQAKNPMAVMQPIGFEENFHAIKETQTAPAMTTKGYGVTQNAGGLGIRQAMAVRRLTPVECERLQGFGDNYTDIQAKGKPTPDGPRYKALGNSMAVPVMAWIGQRIQEVEAICKQNK